MWPVVRCVVLRYLDIVVAAGVGVFHVEGVESEVDDPVDRHLYGPQAVHPGFIARVHVWVGCAKHAHRHGQVAAAPLFRTCKKHRDIDSLRCFCKSEKENSTEMDQVRRPHENNVISQLMFSSLPDSDSDPLGRCPQEITAPVEHHKPQSSWHCGGSSHVQDVPSVCAYVALQPMPFTELSVLKMRKSWLDDERRLGGSTWPQNFPNRGAKESPPSCTAT